MKQVVKIRGWVFGEKLFLKDLFIETGEMNSLVSGELVTLQK